MLIADWPAPSGVHGMMTTRAGGVSRPPWDSWNLAAHVGDSAADVATNRAALREHVPADPGWLNQVHSATVVEAPEQGPPLDADAQFTRAPGRVCAVLTADCLPVLLCDRSGTVVAAAHAGWRGLAGGVLEATVAAMAVPPDTVLAWMGAAIGPQAFEVGAEVRAAFISRHAAAARAFEPVPHMSDKWLADIYQLARLHLAHAGVTAVFGGGLCTLSDPARFFSYRRDGVTGRMASVIWRD